MTHAERTKTLEWLMWYRENRPRHEGSTDVLTQLAFSMKALDGVFATLARLAAEDAREEAGLVQIAQFRELVR